MKRKESFNTPQVQAFCLQKQGKGKYQYKGGQDIQHPGPLDIRNLKPHGQRNDPSACLKVGQHGFCHKRQYVRRPGKQQDAYQELRYGYKSHQISGRRPEYDCRKKVHDCLGNQHGMVPCHGGIHGPENACAAKTEQDDHADKHIQLSVIQTQGKPGFQAVKSVHQVCFQIQEFPDDRADDNGQDNSRQAFKADNQRNPHGDGG